MNFDWGHGSRAIEKIQNAFFSRGMKFLVGLTAISTGFFLYQNCSNVKLQRIENSVASKAAGQVCTQAPTNLDRLQRFIFVFDNSQSIMGQDPPVPARPSPVGVTRRIAGLRTFIDKYKTDDNFTIALGAIYDKYAGFLPDTGAAVGAVPSLKPGCVFFKPRVAGDFTSITQALEQLDTLGRSPQGTTPYSLFFQNVTSCINADLSTNTNGLYTVVIVSDGAPTDLMQSEIVDKTRNLVLAGKANPNDPVAASRVNIIYYSLADLNEDQAVLLNYSVTAAQGIGGFLSKLIVNSSRDPITYKEVVDALKPKYILKQFFATNINSALMPNGQMGTDSDGDGLSDEEELMLGYDPAKYSTYGGCSDLIRHRNRKADGTEICPATCFPGQEYMDSDHDGLSDCDDINLATGPYNFDRDTDGIYDGLEYRIGSNPKDPIDLSSDIDNDGASTIEEARRQTSVYIDDRKIKHATLTNVSIVQVADQNGESCYEITVDGMPLFPTKPVYNTISDFQHDGGANMIKLMFTEVPHDDPTATATLLWGYKVFYYSDYKGAVVRGYSDLSTKDFSIYSSQSP